MPLGYPWNAAAALDPQPWREETFAYQPSLVLGLSRLAGS
jgi:hypothetical protein